MRSKRQTGVTLMELMIVVAIVGILASIAYPSYRAYVLRSNRADAKIGLQQVAQTLEDCFTRFHQYDDDGSSRCAVAAQLAGAGVKTPGGYYLMTIDFGGVSPASAYTLTATPQAGQASDTKCMNFTITQANLHGVSGSGPVSECWEK